MKKVNKAVRHYDLIENGDQIVVAFSGGKDRSSLLSLLNAQRSLASRGCHLVALDVESDINREGYAPPEELEGPMPEEGVEYSFEQVSLFGGGFHAAQRYDRTGVD